MDTVGEGKPGGAGETRTNVIVSSQAMAAIRQLRDDEQTAVYAAVGAIGTHGLRRVAAANVTATELDPSEGVYFLRIAGAPEVRLIAREVDAATFEILDVVRPQTLHNLFHAS